MVECRGIYLSGMWSGSKRNTKNEAHWKASQGWRETWQEHILRYCNVSSLTRYILPMMAMKGDGIPICQGIIMSGFNPIAWHYLIFYCIIKGVTFITKRTRKHQRPIQNTKPIIAMLIYCFPQHQVLAIAMSGNETYISVPTMQ